MDQQQRPRRAGRRGKGGVECSCPQRAGRPRDPASTAGRVVSAPGRVAATGCDARARRAVLDRSASSAPPPLGAAGTASHAAGSRRGCGAHARRVPAHGAPGSAASVPRSRYRWGAVAGPDSCRPPRPIAPRSETDAQALLQVFDPPLCPAAPRGWAGGGQGELLAHALQCRGPGARAGGACADSRRAELKDLQRVLGVRRRKIRQRSPRRRSASANCTVEPGISMSRMARSKCPAVTSAAGASATSSTTATSACAASSRR